MTIYEKLMNIQNELKAPKSQFNSFGKYNYRNCEDILEAVKPLCKKHGCVTYLSDIVTQVGDRYYVMATATVKDIETGDEHSVTAYAREEAEKKGMDGSQVTGASSSYARKYALNGLYAIDDTKDSDTTNGTEPPNPPAQKPPKPSFINLNQRTTLGKLGTEKWGDSAAEMFEKATGYKSSAEVPYDKYDEVLSAIEGA